MTRTLSRSAQLAKDLRTALKSELRLTRKQVSVKTENYSMGSTIHVEIKTLDVSLDTVKAIAKRFENVSRDHMTGEILCGGNRFVDVDYCDGVLDVVAAPLAETLRALLAGTLNSVKFKGVVVKRDTTYSDGFWFSLEGDPQIHVACGPEHAARRIVRTLASA